MADKLASLRSFASNLGHGSHMNATYRSYSPATANETAKPNSTTIPAPVDNLHASWASDFDDQDEDLAQLAGGLSSLAWRDPPAARPAASREPTAPPSMNASLYSTSAGMYGAPPARAGTSSASLLRQMAADAVPPPWQSKTSTGSLAASMPRMQRPPPVSFTVTSIGTPGDSALRQLKATSSVIAAHAHLAARQVHRHSMATGALHAALGSTSHYPAGPAWTSGLSSAQSLLPLPASISAEQLPHGADQQSVSALQSRVAALESSLLARQAEPVPVPAQLPAAAPASFSQPQVDAAPAPSMPAPAPTAASTAAVWRVTAMGSGAADTQRVAEVDPPVPSSIGSPAPMPGRASHANASAAPEHSPAELRQLLARQTVSEAANVRALRSSAQRDAAAMRSSIATLEQELEAALAAAEAAKERAAADRAALDLHKRQADASASTAAADKASALEHERARAQEAISTAQQRVDAAYAQGQAHAQQARALQDRLHNAERQLAEQTRKASSSSAEVAALQSRLSSTSSALHETTAQLSAVEAERDALLHNESALTAQVAQLQAELEHAKTSEARLQKVATDAQRRYNAAQDGAGHDRARAQHAADTAAQAQEERDAIEASLQQALAEASAHRQEVMTSHQRVLRLQEDLSASRRKVAALQRSLEARPDVLPQDKAAAAEVQALRSALTTSQHEIASLQRQLQQQQQQQQPRQHQQSRAVDVRHHRPDAAKPTAPASPPRSTASVRTTNSCQSTGLQALLSELRSATITVPPFPVPLPDPPRAAGQASHQQRQHAAAPGATSSPSQGIHQLLHDVSAALESSAGNTSALRAWNEAELDQKQAHGDMDAQLHGLRTPTRAGCASPSTLCYSSDSD